MTVLAGSELTAKEAEASLHSIVMPRSHLHMKPYQAIFSQGKSGTLIL